MAEIVRHKSMPDITSPDAKPETRPMTMQKVKSSKKMQKIEPIGDMVSPGLPSGVKSSMKSKPDTDRICYILTADITLLAIQV